jgi:PTH1 family peptidyl-tRNA hydrolase
MHNPLRNWSRHHPADTSQPSAATPEARLIVGLGNPGKHYAHNRHNVGFWCLNRLARRAGIDFTQRSRLASVAEGRIGERHVILVKPRTFYNDTGNAVRELLKRHRLQPAQLLVVIDDLDLPVGAVRLKERGSPGGQGGMKSIVTAIGSQEFPRLRIGIGRPSIQGTPSYEPEVIAGYVLADPPSAERALLEQALDQAVEAIETLLTDGIAAAMARYNRR